MGSLAGVMKVAAGRVGLTLDQYQSNVRGGLKWCTGCKIWHARSKFRDDETRGDGLAANCDDYRRNWRRGRGRGFSTVDRIKERARQLIGMRVRRGTLSNPNNLPCMDCGHSGSDRRHEYDHYLGYTGEAKEKVQPVCAKCHRKRERCRRG